MKLYGGDQSKNGQSSARSESGGVRVPRQSSQRNTVPVTSNTATEAAAATMETSDGNDNSRRISMSSAKSNTSLEVAFAQRDEYVYSIVQNLVDNVCLHDARVKAVKREFKNNKAAAAEGEEEAKEDGEDAELQARVAGLSLNPVHQRPDEPAPNVEVMNEVSLPAGRFGWCIVCRNTANMVDAETQHPVCSNECQKKHIVDCASLDSL